LRGLSEIFYGWGYFDLGGYLVFLRFRNLVVLLRWGKIQMSAWIGISGILLDLPSLSCYSLDTFG
jgi:hypothetical protein